MRPILIVLLFPNLQLCPRIRQILEPVHVQALLPQAPVERLNVGIIRRLARPRELQGNLVGIRPEIDNPSDRQLRRAESPSDLRLTALRRRQDADQYHDQRYPGHPIMRGAM